MIIMAEELINMDGIGLALTSIADKIGMTVAQMYEIYVRAQFAIAIAQIVFIIIWAVIVIVVVRKVYVWAYADNKGYESDRMGKMFFGCLATVGLVSFVMMILYDASIAIMCPEYTALQNLMGDIGDMIQLLK